MNNLYPTPSNGIATVYVLDTGASWHSDLPGLGWNSQINTNLNGSNLPVVGCYPHATHVAGIIGAADNGEGVVGMLPGVRLKSLAVGHIDEGFCSSGTLISGYALGLDYILRDNLFKFCLGQCPAKRPTIVNISANETWFRIDGTLGAKLKVLATPAWLEVSGPFVGPAYGYNAGSLVVQSAGNQQEDACLRAYNVTNIADGIIVVGGLDENGQQVQQLNDVPGNIQRGNGYGSQPAQTSVAV